MRIFTKSLLTLALLLLANGVNAQAVWQKVFTQGWVHEWRTDEKQFDDAIEPNSEGVYKVFCRSKDQAEAAGNPTLQDGNFADYDTQFFITWGEEFALKEGDKFKVSFEYMADTPIDGIGTQAHGAPGAYNHWDMIGSVNFTDEWQTFESGEKTISADQGKNSGCWTIAFNLAKGEENTFYFRNIVVEVYGEKRATKTVVSEKTEWKELVNNNDIEGDDVSSFYTRTYPYVDGEPSPHSELAAGVGVDGSRGIRIATNDKVENNWDTQFWIKFNEEVPKGASLTVNFDYRADEDAKTTTQSHTSKPGENSYIWYSMIGDVNFTTEWEHFENTVTVSGDQSTAEKPMGSIAFNMNENDGGYANVYYLDNISVKTGSLVNDVTNMEEGIQVLFTDWTNMPDLITEYSNGKRRLYAPNDCVKVTINGEEAVIGSVEYDREGQLFIFLDDDYLETHAMEENDVVVVSFTNPEDAKYRLVYTNGSKKDQPVEDFTATSVYDAYLDITSFANSAPEVESTEPENNSFCLPATIAEFKVKFDKNVKTAKVTAYLDRNEKLKVEAAGEFDTDVVLKRTGKDALAEGEHTIVINNVFSQKDLQEVENPDHTLTFSVGPAAVNEKLQYALEQAHTTLDDNADERYAGEAYTALDEAVTKYEAEGATYTAPSQVTAAVQDLGLKTDAMKTHRANCDDYDTNLATAVELVAQYEESKFAQAELFGKLKEAVGKYEGKELTNDDELKEAVADLKNNVAAGQQMFTEGVSKNGDAGIKVLVDRIRQGAEALQNSFEVAEDDDIIVAANNALTDDDELANKIKLRMKVELYNKLKDGDDSLFGTNEDEDGNVTVTGPNMTVFVKNPNTYALLPKNGVNEENTPGWTQISGEGYNNMGLYGSGGASWGNPRNIEGLPEDCAFTVYHSLARVEQTITDLPAGTYTVTWNGTDWGNMMENNGVDALGFVYCKLSDTPAPEEGEEEDRDVHFAATFTSFYATPQYSMDGVHAMEEIVVTDGQLTIGLQTGGDSQYFYGDVKLTLTAPAPGFDYTTAYNQAVEEQNGIQSVKETANKSVYYDLQGRRVAKPAKGLYIKSGKKLIVK